MHHHKIDWIQIRLANFVSYIHFKIFQILSIGYKHKLPSIVRMWLRRMQSISPRTISGKDTKNLESQGFLKDFWRISLRNKSNPSIWSASFLAVTQNAAKSHKNRVIPAHYQRFWYFYTCGLSKGIVFASMMWLFWYFCTK